MTTRTETAILAGGCFWGMQDLLRRYPGVVSTRVGYSGGDVPNATYRNHGTHAEAIEIVFDPAQISYRQILEFFFQIHDPTTMNRQGSGPTGSSHKSCPRARSGRLNRSIRTTSNTIPTVTPAISFGQTGNCPNEANH
jgi:peptide-methionine (S)-S-oxide reductase